MKILELKNISKNFGAVHALENVDLDITPGEALGLMGDNGAGKSTLVKIIAGNFAPTNGEIFIAGKKTSISNPLEARNHGIEIVYQDLKLCNNLTASANVFLGREINSGFGFFSRLKHTAMNDRAGELFEELQSETRPKDLVEQMSGGQRQAVALARTRLSDPKLVLLDEPTAAISILVSHRMMDVFEVCDRVAVLRRGNKIADKPIANTSPEEVTGLITGALEKA